MFLAVVLPLLGTMIFGGALVAAYLKARQDGQHRTFFFRFEFIRYLIGLALIGVVTCYGIWTHILEPLMR